MRRHEFFERVPELFQRGNLKEWESYEETLYAMQRPLTHGNYYRIQRFVGAATAAMQALRDARVYAELDRLLSKARYPRAGQITRLEDFCDGSTELATALLHFNNPAYPIYDRPTVIGLNRLGHPVNFVPHINEHTAAAYQAYVDIIQEFKDEVPYYFVPERHYYLTRIVQVALREFGLETPKVVRAQPTKTASRRAGPPEP